MVNRVVPVEKSASFDDGQRAVDQVALDLARTITKNSPDSVFVTKEALLEARDADPSAIKNMLGDRSRLLYVGKNINEGLEAFKQVSIPFPRSS